MLETTIPAPLITKETPENTPKIETMDFWTIQPDGDRLRSGQGLSPERPDHPEARSYLGQLVLRRTLITSEGRLDTMTIYHISELDVMAIVGPSAPKSAYDSARALNAQGLREPTKPGARTCIGVPRALLQTVFGEDLESPKD